MKESKAYQEILAEGEEVGSRKTLLAFVEARFGKRQAASFRNALKNVDDPHRIATLVSLAANCSKVDELINAASS